MYLLDSNIILELLLNQEGADEVEAFLRTVPPERLCLSEFSLYSLGIILVRSKKQAIFLQALEDLLITGGMRLVRLDVVDIQNVVKAAHQFNLDFDDAYQYVVAKKYGLTIVSFDNDFDRTESGRKTPAEMLTS